MATDAKDAKWIPSRKLPNLGYDHNKMVAEALKRLQMKLYYEPIGFNLLKGTFRFSDLENVYTTILGRKIDRRNFRKKIMSFNILEEVEIEKSKGSGRPAMKYKFNKSRYKQLMRDGIRFEIKFA